MTRKLDGTFIQSGTITVNQLAGGLNDTSNASYAQANAAYSQANTARGQSNTAYAQANTAYSRANVALAAANSSGRVHPFLLAGM